MFQVKLKLHTESFDFLLIFFFLTQMACSDERVSRFLGFFRENYVISLFKGGCNYVRAKCVHLVVMKSGLFFLFSFVKFWSLE